MLLNFTFVPTRRRLESKTLGFVLTLDRVASAGDCVNEFIMLNASQLTGPFCFLHTRLQSACLCSLRLSEEVTSDTLTLMSPLIRMVEGVAPKHISQLQGNAGQGESQSTCSQPRGPFCYTMDLPSRDPWMGADAGGAVAIMDHQFIKPSKVTTALPGWPSSLDPTFLLLLLFRKLLLFSQDFWLHSVTE